MRSIRARPRRNRSCPIGDRTLIRGRRHAAGLFLPLRMLLRKLSALLQHLGRPESHQR
jgi:hypothetical protein